ncbi:MAG: alpha/beta hydrolase [Pseudomonadota bacterium]
MSIRAQMISTVLRRTLKKQMASFTDHTRLRKQAGAGFGRLPDAVQTQAVDAGGVSAEWVRWQTAQPGKAILYLHGGGYVFGSLDSHRGLVWRISRASGCDALVVDYRLAPEHVFPAAVEDALASYQWLLQQGIAAEQVVVAGDSAGGGLALALLLKLREMGQAQPAAAVLLSPWADLTLSGESVQKYADRDAMLSPAALQRFTELYLGDADPRSPLVSPVFADLKGLPPSYVLVGSEEVLRDDAERLVENMRRQGGEAQLEVWPRMPHVFPLLAPLIPEAERAINDVGRFIQARLG